MRLANVYATWLEIITAFDIPGEYASPSKITQKGPYATTISDLPETI